MTETFNPEGNGWTLQRDYRISPRWQVAEDERELGNVASVAVAEKAIRELDLTYKATTQAAYDYAQSFLNRHRGPAGRFLFGFPEHVPSPDKAPDLEAVAGGTQGLRDLSIRFCWLNPNGRTLASPSGSLQVPANNLIKVTLPSYPPSVTQAVIFGEETTSGNEQEQVILTHVKTWTQPDAALLVLTTPVPTSNAALESPVCKLVQGGYSIVRGIGRTYTMRLQLEEVY